MIKVIIRECKTDGNVWESIHRTDNQDLAIQRAVKKRWGAKATYREDSGLKGYGQIWRVLKPCGSTWEASAITYRVSVCCEN
jgi:hypothetical protein